MNPTLKNNITVSAPARVCLFGDHQDYLGLPVIACAINRQVVLSAESNNDGVFHILMPDIFSERHISISETFETLDSRDYFGSALRVLKRNGCSPTEGYNLIIKSDIPINAGVSSSSAVLVVWIHFLLKAFGCNQELTSELIAQLSYEAEVIEHNSPGGFMDQYSISLGNIVYIDAASDLKFETIGTSIEGLVLAESGEPKDTLGLLNYVRKNTSKAIDMVLEKAPEFNLKQATMMDYSKYSTEVSEDLKPFFYAAIKNHTITQEALKELKKEQIDYKLIGQLMTKHHLILKEQLRVTTPKIDAMIKAALIAGAFGAKIVGSGGGGSIVALSPLGKEDQIINSILESGAKAAFKVSVTKGTLNK